MERRSALVTPHRFTSLLLLLAAGCASDGPFGPAAPRSPSGRLIIPMDEHSHARPNEVRVTHVSLELDLDFDKRQARGSAELSLERLDPSAPLMLDAQGIVVDKVTGAGGEARKWKMGEEDAIRGPGLAITLRPRDTKVTIDYHTTDRSAALQWLSPEQTEGGKHPFLFTQGQSIFTRTWIPLQDSPGVRVTYDATVRAPRELTPVMSAEQLGRGPDGAWRFRMAQPIPSYLIALACGDIAFKEISRRSGVWAEKKRVKAARDELNDTEAMIQAAESLFGPYRWDRYDVIILPPAFPFGGMENPRLTFATPTILAGDKSLVALVAHELAHSWSGNLVTNATWRDFWLNEGFTVYFQQRIMERVYGSERSDLEKQLAYHELTSEMATLEKWQQVLYADLTGKHPDDAFSSVPYEKGALFLSRLEQVFGRERFDMFLRGYFDAHAFQSITTGHFVSWLKKDLLAGDPEKAKAIDVETWVTRPGLPQDAPQVTSPLLTRVDEERKKWLGGAKASELDTRRWVTQQWQHFINHMPADVSAARLAELDEAFKFTATQNSEVLCDWLVLATKRRYAAVNERLEQFLLTVGRRKYLKPLYTELARSPDGAARARAIYAKARPRYHAVSTGTIDKILGWKA